MTASVEAPTSAAGHCQRRRDIVTWSGVSAARSVSIDGWRSSGEVARPVRRPSNTHAGTGVSAGGGRSRPSVTLSLSSIMVLPANGTCP